MRHRRPILIELLELLVTALVLALFVRTFLFQAFSIPSGSMEQGLLVGDKILVNKFIYSQQGPTWLSGLLPTRPVQRGDVVVFRYPLDPDRNFVKRCVAQPNDTVELAQRRLLINGTEVDESGYTHYTDDRIYPRNVALPDALRTRDNYGPYTLPPESYFCLGDNRNNSNDSRHWGTVPAANVKGRGWLIYWSNARHQDPPSPIASNQELGGSTKTAEKAAEEATETNRAPPGKTSGSRWDRILKLVR